MHAWTVVTLLLLLPHYARSFTDVLGRVRQRQRRQGRRQHHDGLLATPARQGNLLGPIQQLQQDYFALRHGQSLANVAGLIMSDPASACTEYGLTDTGKEQAAQAAKDVRQAFLLAKDDYYDSLVILASDLKRAKETAMIVFDKNSQELPILQDQVIVETRLRERWFGEWDGSSDANYNKVWIDDALDADHTIKGVESVHQVMTRTTECILEWDKRLAASEKKRCMVVLVAHGDVLQILQTAFEKMDGRKHRDLPHLETAQLRQLNLATS